MPDAALSGDWSEDAMRETAQSFYGLGSDASLPDDVRFRVGVARVIRERLRQVGARVPAVPAVFFLLPEGPENLDQLDHDVLPMLDNGLTPVTGKLLFVGPVAARGIALDIDEWSDEAVFQHALELGLKGIPAVLFEPRTEPVTARFYPQGLDNPDSYDSLHLAETAVTLDEIFERIDQLHRQGLATPKVQGQDAPLWEKPLKKCVSEHAERRIQFRLRLFLQGAFPLCKIREEQDEVAGRLDLEIEQQDQLDPSQVVRHALLELKVVKTYNVSGHRVSQHRNETAVSDGVTQAASYRDERGTRAAALCCFDMREAPGPDCVAHARELAALSLVEVRYWPIFSSAKEYREALRP